LNYLPASLGSLPNSSRFWIASQLHPAGEHPMPWNMSATGDHRVGSGWLGYVTLVVMCAEGFELVYDCWQYVNHINAFSGKFFPEAG
jgi:hypothetical protein